MMQAPRTQVCPVAQRVPHDPQLELSLAVLTHAPEQATWPVGHTQVPLALHTPPATPEQAPEVRGDALHAVVVPEHTMVPVASQPPEPPPQERPVARHVPPQFD